MHKTLTLLLLWVVAAGCKTDVGPKKKVASDKITSHRGALWNHAHVLALRRVKKGRYGGRGGIGSYRRGYMRYYLVLDGVGKPRRVFLYESLFRAGKGKGYGVDKLILRASPDDRCVAYSKDGGRRWRLIRLMGPGFWLHFPRPDIQTKSGHKDPCAKAPSAQEHFLALLVGKHRLYTQEMRGVLKVLALHPKNFAYQHAFAQFMITDGRRQYFHTNLPKLWRPVQKIVCQQARLRRVYLGRLKERVALGSRHHRNAMLALEYCPRPEIQDSLAILLWGESSAGQRDVRRLEAARCFARITEIRKAVSGPALINALRALPRAKRGIQAYIARALGSLGGKAARAALTTLIGQIEVTLEPGKAPRHLPKADWPTFDQFVKRLKNTPQKDQKYLVLQTARAALKR